MSEKAIRNTNAVNTGAAAHGSVDSRLARLETDMGWVRRLLWFVIALIIGIYLDLPAVVQGLLP